MAKSSSKKPVISPERLEEIRASVASGRHKSMFDDPTPDMERFHGPMCRCGLFRKPAGLAKHVIDDGRCTAHPDREPQKGRNEQ